MATSPVTCSPLTSARIWAAALVPFAADRATTEAWGLQGPVAPAAARLGSAPQLLARLGYLATASSRAAAAAAAGIRPAGYPAAVHRARMGLRETMAPVVRGAMDAPRPVRLDPAVPGWSRAAPAGTAQHTAVRAAAAVRGTAVVAVVADPRAPAPVATVGRVVTTPIRPKRQVRPRERARWGPTPTARSPSPTPSPFPPLSPPRRPRPPSPKGAPAPTPSRRRAPRRPPSASRGACPRG